MFGYAQTTNTFTGASGGLWSAATNWSLGTVPTTNQNVLINSNTTVNVQANSSAGAITLSGNDARINVQLNVPLSASGITCTGTSGNVPIYMDAGTLNLNGGAGSITTSGGVHSYLHINGDATVNLASANLTYLWLKSGGSAPAQLTITNGQTFSAVITYLAGIPASGQSTLNLSGGTLNAGTMIFNVTAGAYTNTFNLNSGTLTADTIRRDFDGTSLAFNWNDGTIQNRSGGNLTISRGGSATTNMILSLAGTGTHTFNADSGRTITVASTATLADKSGEQGTLAKAGAGELIFQGTNTYTGLTTIKAGTLSLTNGSAIADTGAVTLSNASGATLAVNSSETIGSLRGGGSTGGNVSVASGQTLTVAETGSQAFAGAITSAGGLTKSGAGTTRLSGANTYSGATTIAAGTLQVGDGGTTGAIGSTSGISISNGATLAFNRSDSYGGNFTRTISGAGGVVLSAGTLTLQNTGNSFTGGVTANGGKFQTLGNSAGNTIVVNSGGTLAMAGTDTWGNATTTTTPAITLNAGGTMTSDGFFNSIRDLTLNGGTVFLNGGLGSVVSAFTLGGTVTAGGEATSTIAVASGSNNAIRLGRQGTSESTTFNVSNANGQLSVGTVLDNNFGSISGLTKSGSGRMVLSASNTYTGGTTISGGTLELGNGGSVQGNITNHAILSMNRTDSFTLSNAISGSGAVTKSGLGTVTLTGSNTYTGLTTVSAGSLVVSNALWAATLLPGSTTVNFASVPAAGTNNLLPGPLATASLAATTFTGLGIGQTASLTNAPNLKVILSALPPANQKPVVSPGQSFRIAETSAAGTRVGTLTATDADSQAVSLTGWTLVSGNSGSAFVLNWSTGELSVQGNLDYEAVPFYTLMVTVSDGKASSDPVSVTVQVADVAEFADGFGSASAATETNAAGLPNLAAYALGAAHPNSVVPLPVLAMNTTPAATYLTLTALVRTNDPRGRLVGNATTNLASWPTNPFIAGTPTSDQTGVDPGVTQRQAFQVEVGSDTRKFLRLEAPAGMALANPLPNTATIQAQIDAAVASGQSQVRIQPGVYTNIVPVGSDPHLRLANLSNLDIDATDVTLVCSRMVRAIFIRDCTNVTLSGLTIDYVPLPMTQGTITGFGPSREWTDVRIHDGYPAPAALTNGWSFLWASDPLTRRIRPGMANRPNQSMTNMGGGVWRVAHGASFSDTAAVGDYLRIPQPVVDNTALVANRCSNLTLSNITLYSAPFHFGASFGWNDRLTLQSCRIVPGPTPPGATEPRLFSAVGDGFHFENTTGGLSILDCETDSTGDDGIAIYDMPLLVGAVADGGKTITLSFAIAGGTDSRWAKRPTAGTRFRFYVAATGTIEEGLVTNRTSSSMTTSAWTTLRNQIVPTTVPANMYNEPFVVQLQSAVSAAPGDEARLLDDPYETVVRGCRVRNSGSRGIVANTSRVRLENNQIEDTLLPAVHIKAFTKDGGPGFHDDISIRSNTITRGNLSRSTSSDFLGSICVVNWDTNQPSFGGHRRLTIEDNQIAESWGVDVQVHTASDVIVRGNRFVDSHRLSAGNGSPRAVDNTSAIFLQDVQSVLIQSNQLVRPGPYYGSQPLRTQNVTDLQAAEAFLPAQP